MLRLIADENMPVRVIVELRRLGHDVLAAREVMPSAPDEDVLARAEIERRVVVTFDKGFGELAFRHGLAEKCGVILLRLEGHSRDADVRRAIEVITSREDWPGTFATATEVLLRIRSFPSDPDSGDLQ
jgi:predicted nuclease of predicted toxin-antitoxin system